MFSFPEESKFVEIKCDYLHVYLLESNKDSDLIYFGGNETNFNEIRTMSIHFNNFSNVIYPLYSGYFPHKGQTNEIELMIQMHALKDFIKKRNKKVFVYGFSLGCSLALYFNKILSDVDKVFLVNPFYSLPRTVGQMVPFIWFVKYFITDKYENYLRITNCKNYLMIIYSENDNLIDPNHSKKLYAIYSNKFPGSNKCSLIEIKECDHNLIFEKKDFYIYLSDFFCSN